LSAARFRCGLRRAAGLALLAGLVLTCSAGAPAIRRSAGGLVPTGHPRAALVPFENLAGREGQGSLFSKVFFAQLVASGALEMVDPGRVDEAMDSLGIRSGGSLVPEQIRALGDTLHAPCVLLGSVLESGKIQSGGVDVPAVGATLRLVDAASGRVLWAGVHFRSGEDHETLFGWGRVVSAERLVSLLAQDLLTDFREAGARYRKSAGGKGPR
jgi:TolB-like protein